MRTIISLLFLFTAVSVFAEEVPDDGAAHYRLGSTLMDNDGDLDEAVAHFVRAGELQFQPIGVAFRSR